MQRPPLDLSPYHSLYRPGPVEAAIAAADIPGMEESTTMTVDGDDMLAAA